MGYSKLHALLEESWDTNNAIRLNSKEVKALVSQKNNNKKKELLNSCNDKEQSPAHLIMLKINAAHPYYAKKLYSTAALLLTKKSIKQKDTHNKLPLGYLEPSKRIEFDIWYLKQKTINDQTIQTHTATIEHIVADLVHLSNTDELADHIVNTYKDTKKDLIKFLMFKKNLDDIKKKCKHYKTKKVTSYEEKKKVTQLIDRIYHSCSYTNKLSSCKRIVNILLKEKGIDMPEQLIDTNETIINDTYKDALQIIFQMPSNVTDNETKQMLIAYLLSSGLPALTNININQETLTLFNLTLLGTGSNMIEWLYEIATETLPPKYLLLSNTNQGNTPLHHLFNNPILTHKELLYFISLFYSKAPSCLTKKNKQGKLPVTCFLPTTKFTLFHPSSNQWRERLIAGFSFVLDFLWENTTKNIDTEPTVAYLSHNMELLFEAFQEIITHVNLFELITLKNIEYEQASASDTLTCSLTDNSLVNIEQDLKKLIAITEANKYPGNTNYTNFRKHLTHTLCETKEAALFYNGIIERVMKLHETFFNRKLNWQNLEGLTQNHFNKTHTNKLISKRKIHQKPFIDLHNAMSRTIDKNSINGTGTVVIKQNQTWKETLSNNCTMVIKKDGACKKSLSDTDATVSKKNHDHKTKTIQKEQKNQQPSVSSWIKENPTKVVISLITTFVLFVSFVSILTIAIASNGGTFLGLSALSSSIASWVSQHAFISTLFSSFNFTGGALLIAAMGSLIVTGIAFCLSASIAILQYQWIHNKSKNAIKSDTSLSISTASSDPIAANESEISHSNHRNLLSQVESHGKIQLPLKSETSLHVDNPTPNKTCYFNK